MALLLLKISAGHGKAAEPQPRILIADDDPSIWQLIDTIVRREGLIVDSVADGQEAIEKLQEASTRSSSSI